MYEEIEQGDNIAKGCVEVKEMIAYDFVRIDTNEVGKKTVIEKSRLPYFCQRSEQEKIFRENNPGVREEDSKGVIIAASGVRIESFTIQLLESTAREKIDNPENVKQFTRKEPADLEGTTTSKEPTWQEQANRLGISTDGRTRKDVMAEIDKATTASTN